MRSEYSHGYEFDVFISYSSRDLAWVKTFHDDLVADANRHARHDIVVFFDKSRLQPGFVWKDRLVSAARSAAIMLPVLSARFFDSEYCQKELNAFIEAHGMAPGRSHQSRVMPVNLLCAAPSSHVLNGFQATTFFTQDGGVPYEYEPGTPLYRETVRKIAFAIAQILNGLLPAQMRPTVYVASDFKGPSEKLRASLSHHYAVVPERPSELVGLTPTELDQSLQQDFDRSFASVHVLSNATFAQPLIERQLDCARSRKKPRLVWSAERPDHLTSEGFEWFTSQSELEDYLRRLLEKPREVRPTGREPTIYFLCPDRANKTNAAPLLAALEERGILHYPSPLEGSPDQAIQTHISMLDELDGCLIYYGDVDRSWFDAVFIRVRKKIRQRRLPSAIFLAPPPTDHKLHDLSALGVPLVQKADAAAQAFLGASA
jgi:TIR domain